MAKLEKGMVFNAKNVIDYAEGGVVSKASLSSVLMQDKVCQNTQRRSTHSSKSLMEAWS